MRAEWYGDKRDLIKWGCLLALAKRRKTGKIFQIAFCTETNWPKLHIGDEDGVDLPERVRKHFRDVDKIQELGDGQVEIEILSYSPEQRDAYLDKVLQEIAEPHDVSRIVFLDPDTGLEPDTPPGTKKRKTSGKHVSESDVKRLWEAMSPGDILALYQHMDNRRGDETWIERKQKQLSKALSECHVEVARESTPKTSGKQPPVDVVILYCQKPG